MGLKKFLMRREMVAFSLVMIVLGCSAMNYKYYGLSDVVYEHGTLLGPKSKDDLPFARCQPNAMSKNPCVVLFAQDFFALKQEFEDMKARLVQCEKK